MKDKHAKAIEKVAKIRCMKRKVTNLVLHSYPHGKKGSMHPEEVNTARFSNLLGMRLRSLAAKGWPSSILRFSIHPNTLGCMLP